MNFQEISKNRRSINFFNPDKDVSENLLREMVEIAANTPSSFNLQPWNLMALRNVEEKEKLKSLAWDQPKVTEAPVVLIKKVGRKATLSLKKTGKICSSPVQCNRNNETGF